MITDGEEAGGCMEIQRARPEDAPIVRRIALDAYQPYIRRIGRKPAPMLADYAALVAAGKLWIRSEIAEIVGYIVLEATEDALVVENVAVHPERHGEGHGRALLDFAEREARRRGLPRLALYTNAKMSENIGLYLALGWRETERRHEAGFDRVFFEKPAPGLASSSNP
ncbi:MAG: GNAT family N-acetyltransferase [Pikeienuella sp.]|uniref:GNAT family N-acetyltransferase n=1 Tax=Pikeienuella sp. TaxID=2831957 RepID=UPI00391CBF1E